MEEDFFQLPHYPSVKTRNRQTSALQYRALKFTVAVLLMISILNIALGYAYIQFTEHQVMNESRQRLARYDEITSQLATKLSETHEKIKILDEFLQNEWPTSLVVTDEMEEMRQRLDKDEILSSKTSKNISDNVDKQALNLTKRIEALEASNNCQWVQSHGGQIPPGAIVAGKDKNGLKLYVARCWDLSYKSFSERLSPKVYIPWIGQKTFYDECQVLCNCAPRWLPMNGGEIPAGAFIAGETLEDQSLYLGRAEHDGSLIPGKVMVRGNDYRPVCYIYISHYFNEVIAKYNFDIMVY